MKKKDDFIKRVIIAMAIFLFVFTVVMIITYYKMGDIPDALVAAVFTACLGEGSITGFIQTTKLKHQSLEVDSDENINDTDDIFIDADEIDVEE